MPQIHPLSDVATDNIGDGTRVWQFSVILAGAKIGRDCNICAHTLIEGKVDIGNNVTIKSGVYIWDNTVIEDNVFIGPNVSFTNDKYPKSRFHDKEFSHTLIKSGTSIGANVTILPGVTIGVNCLIGAGSIVTKDVPDYSKVYGESSKIRGSIQDES